MHKLLFDTETAKKATDIAKDLLSLYRDETSGLARKRLRRVLRRLEPLISGEAERLEPMSKAQSVELIVAALEEVRARAEYLAGM